MSILVVLNHRLENMVFWMLANITITATITYPVIYISCLTCSTYCIAIFYFCFTIFTIFCLGFESLAV